MKNYILKDLETGNPGLVMQFPDDTSAIRAVKTALRKPESIYAQFPDKFQLVCIGEMQLSEYTYVMTENRQIAFDLTSFLEVKEGK